MRSDGIRRHVNPDTSKFCLITYNVRNRITKSSARSRYRIIDGWDSSIFHLRDRGYSNLGIYAENGVSRRNLFVIRTVDTIRVSI